MRKFFRRLQVARALEDKTSELVGSLVEDAVREERRRIAAWLRQDDGVDPDQAAINRVIADVIERGSYVA